METRGRPRSDAARRAVLAAALELHERDGWRGVTVEAIAAAAGVGKATIYRWWPGKAAVLMDALTDASEDPIAFGDSGSALTDLREQIAAVVAFFTGTADGAALLTVVAESRTDPDLARELRERLIAHRRAGAREVLARGVSRGELRADLDPELVIDALYGAVYYRLLVSGDPLGPGYADALLDQFAPALLPPQEASA